MPAPSPPVGPILEKTLRDLGQKIRSHRKRMKLSATATAEAAGMSRVTLHRIERGEASVAIGAYLSAVSALGLSLEVTERQKKGRQSLPKPPQKIRLADYPQLKKLAWQLKGTLEISAKEALEIYERNWRHVDFEKMDPLEHGLVETLLAAFGRERLLV